MTEIETTSRTAPITLDNLPRGLRWEEDGSCWECVTCDPKVFGCEWRWQPKNWKALEKGEPEGVMHDFPPNHQPIFTSRTR